MIRNRFVRIYRGHRRRTKMKPLFEGDYKEVAAKLYNYLIEIVSDKPKYWYFAFHIKGHPYHINWIIKFLKERGLRIYHKPLSTFVKVYGVKDVGRKMRDNVQSAPLDME